MFRLLSLAPKWPYIPLYINNLLVSIIAHSPVDSPIFGFKNLDLGSIASPQYRGSSVPLEIDGRCRYRGVPTASAELGLNRQRLPPPGRGSDTSSSGRCHSPKLKSEIRPFPFSSPRLSVIPHLSGKRHCDE
jgi:hypothetical protein